MPVARVVITKEIDYRGGRERFANGYRFNLDTIDEATIHALSEALIGMERGIHAQAVRFVYANGGRDAKGARSVYVEEFATPRTGTQVTGAEHPEICVMAESKRRQRVYARKFFHTCYARSMGGGAGERLHGDNAAEVTNSLGLLTNGQLPGGARYCWPDGTPVETAFTADPFRRTRQFDRRGKRPTQPPPQAGG